MFPTHSRCALVRTSMLKMSEGTLCLSMPELGPEADAEGVGTSPCPILKAC